MKMQRIKEQQIIYVKVEELKLNPKNPRQNDKAVDAVAKSIERFGFRNPLLIDKDKMVWCGNTRLKASIKLGLEKVPCLDISDLTKKQIRELALLDNKTNEIADWDLDLLAEELGELDLAEFELDWGVSELLNPDDLDTDFNLPDGDKSEIEQITFTLHHEQAELIKYAMGLVKDEITETFGNQNSNGNAIYEVVRQWVEQRK